jgi:hypothetical protein
MAASGFTSNPEGNTGCNLSGQSGCTSTEVTKPTSPAHIILAADYPAGRDKKMIMMRKE